MVDPAPTPAPTVRALTCPNCGAAVPLRSGDLAQNVVCASCHSILDAHDPNLRVLQHYAEKMTYKPAIPLGTRGELKGDKYEVIGFQVRSITADGTDYAWREYLLWNPYKGFRYLTEYDGHWNDTIALKVPPVHPHDDVSVVEHLGETFKHFQTAEATTRFILGEFPWEVRYGDRATVTDYVSPPHVVSEEVTKDERTWSLGTYTQPETIWKAFALPGSPPPRIGTYENQPDPYAGTGRGYASTFAVLVLILFVLLIVREVTAARQVVFSQSFGFNGTSGDSAAFVTQPFVVAGHTSNVQVEINTDLSNNWAYFNVALINDQSGAAYDFGREVSYYSGRDDDGPWSEGSQQDRSFLPAVPPGRYYLRIQPENDTHQPFFYTVRLIRDVPRASWYLIGMLLLAIPPLFTAIRYWRFEAGRWQESDHPMVTVSTSSGSDDE